MPTSNTRPWWRTLPRKLRLNCLPWPSGTATFRSTASIRSASITAAISMPIGQRVVQASHEAHSQMACDSSTSASAPSCTSRMHLAGQQVHVGADRAAGGALVALEARADAACRCGARLRRPRPSRSTGRYRTSCSLEALASRPTHSGRLARCITQFPRIDGHSPIPSISASISASLRGHHLAIYFGRRRRTPSTVSRSSWMRMPNSRSFSSR